MKRFLILSVVLFVYVQSIYSVPKGKSRVDIDYHGEWVLFYYKPEAGKNIPEKVFIGASFNGWKPDDQKCLLLPQKDGSFSRVIFLKPGINEFHFIINGKWIYDMEVFAKKHDIKPYPDEYKDDGFGGKSAVLIIKKK